MAQRMGTVIPRDPRRYRKRRIWQSLPELLKVFNDIFNPPVQSLHDIRAGRVLRADITLRDQTTMKEWMLGPGASPRNHPLSPHRR